MRHATFSAAALALAAAASQAAVSDRGPDMFFDDDSGLTYLRIGAASSAFDDGDLADDGRLSHDAAAAWAASLSVPYLGQNLTGWRLPAHGEKTYGPATGWAWHADLAPVAAGATLVLTVEGYVIKDPVHAWPPTLAWTYGRGDYPGVVALELNDGRAPYRQYGQAYAVFTGDVTPVPEPATWLLMALGIAASSRATRRRATRPTSWSPTAPAR